MGGHWVWWIAAAVLVGAELLTGTFYLLAVGIAAAIGGVAAWLGAGAAAAVPRRRRSRGVVLTIAAHQWRKRQAPPRAQALARRRPGGARADAGTPTAPRASRIAARTGTPSSRRLDTPRADTLYIVATRGSVLVLSDRRPAA